MSRTKSYDDGCGEKFVAGLKLMSVYVFATHIITHNLWPFNVSLKRNIIFEIALYKIALFCPILLCICKRRRGMLLLNSTSS